MPAIPSDEDVVAALNALNGRADATALVERLTTMGHSQGKAQLAVQQAFDHKRILLNEDWTFGIARTRAAA